MELYSKLARLYIPAKLEAGASISLGADQAHYLRGVLRKAEGDLVRVFNPEDGEWEACLKAEGKKGAQVALRSRLRPPAAPEAPVHLIFAPIRKQRMDFLIEKAAELGVTHLHPVITQRTQNRHTGAERLAAQIAEASEQCERMSIPVLEEPLDLPAFLRAWPRDRQVLWCLEQPGLQALSASRTDDWGHAAFLIGPEGGFTEEEITMLKGYENFIPVSLGQRLLRAETACLLCLSHVQLQRMTS